jgi:hypothetical protein
MTTSIPAHKKRRQAHNFKELAGKRYTRLTVVRLAKRSGKTYWECLCDCGATVVVSGGNLSSGNSKSCGCLCKERTSAASKTHGMSEHPLFKVWSGIKKRCTNPKTERWPVYGGRGIKICDRWKDSFENFYADMAPGYQKGLQIDRIDNDGDYCPENCRWVTAKENSRNRRSNRLIDTPWGRITVKEASEKAGVADVTIRKRLKRGLSGTPLLQPAPAVRVFDTPWGRLPLSQAAELSGVGLGTLRFRERAGDTGDRLFRPVAKRKAA